MFIPLGFTSKSVQTSLGKIVYYTNDRPPWNDLKSNSPETLVFLHGLGGGSSAYEWSKVYPAFAAEYRILAPDMLGWGRSEHPERDYQVDDYVTTIAEFLSNTCTSPVTVIASALTAAFTIRVAIANPQLFKSMILTTAAGLNEFGRDYQDNFFTKLAGTPIIDRLLYSTGVATSFGIRGFLEQRQFASKDRVDSELVEAYLQSAQQPNGEYSALSFVRGDLCFDLTQYITQLTIPTALIWGQESEYIGPRVGRRLQEMNPQAIRIMYQLNDVGFTPQLELPAITIGLIRQFLPQLETSNSQSVLEEDLPAFDN
ncbi:Alpha/beta hydrolase fold protein [Hyella patelloides LEGE 07179]|uniref:Alpha/beta hydrolase fold protein n=1 Tax=Hyella patelloides LEGE 07179 TaxID=945734 RepID=A0A563VQ82_9CYAN|nr:alpha/beta hydrolase [Hyella patelloides]VEP13628.1 Alpha/beta hydrolase fold protein [Hyella patelloides LEGE 07179]